MKKSIKLFICLTLIFVCAFMSPVGVNGASDSSSEAVLYEAEFSLSNPNEQTKTFKNGDKTICLKMGEDLSLKTRETIPIGSFNRYFTYDDGIITMKARYTGSVNPYNSFITEVSDGRYNSLAGTTFIRDRYSWGSLSYAPSNAYGKYEVDYTLPVIGGTKTHTLMVSIKPTFSGGVVKVTLGSNI